MKSILHLKEDTEYQIPLRETEKDDRAKVGTTEAGKAVNKEKVTTTQSQEELPDAQKSKNDQLRADSEAAKEAKKETDEISQEEVNDDSSAIENLEEDPEEKERQTTEENNNKDTTTTTESAPQVDSVKAALDEMKKLASQEGVVHPSLFISNFSKILGLMERAMQLQVKESGSATEESGSVTKEEAPKATEPATEQTETLEKTEVPEQTETPAENK